MDAQWSKKYFTRLEGSHSAVCEIYSFPSKINIQYNYSRPKNSLEIRFIVLPFKDDDIYELLCPSTSGLSVHHT